MDPRYFSKPLNATKVKAFLGTHELEKLEQKKIHDLRMQVFGIKIN
jgi:hypothetical protein